MRLSIFGTRSLTAANVVMLALGGGMFAIFFFATLYVQEILRLSPVQAGLGLLPLTAAIIAASGVAPAGDRPARERDPGRAARHGDRLAGLGGHATAHEHAQALVGGLHVGFLGGAGLMAIGVTLIAILVHARHAAVISGGRWRWRRDVMVVT